MFVLQLAMPKSNDFERWLSLENFAQQQAGTVNTNLRHREIIEMAQRGGRVTVETLAEHFQVTLQTIRRDLTELSNAGQLERVHGGAIAPSGTKNIAYEERRELNAGAKENMARYIASNIPNGASVFLSIGTSTEAVARHLLRHTNLLVVTNNIKVSEILRANTSCDLILTGGRFRRADSGLTGEMATKMIRQFKFDIAVMSCSSLDTEGNLLDFDIDEVGVNQTILEHSRRTVLVADHTKFQRKAPVRIASFEDFAEVVTDRPIESTLLEKCAAWETLVSVIE